MMKTEALVVGQDVLVEIAIVHFMVGGKRVVIALINKSTLGIVLT